MYLYCIIQITHKLSGVKTDMRRAFLLIFIILLTFAIPSAYAMALQPAETEQQDLSYGTYPMAVNHAETWLSEGYLDLDLFLPERYPIEQICQLQKNDLMIVNGIPYTVSNVSKQDEFIEVMTDRDECIVFTSSGDGEHCFASLNDFVACSFIDTYRITAPLPDSFIFNYTDEELTSEHFFDLVTSGSCFVTQYNTTVTLKNGDIIQIDHYDYPEGVLFGGVSE